MKKVLLSVLVLFVAVAAVAQEKENRTAENKIVRGPYETNRFFDNVFVGVAGGINIYAGENDNYGSYGKKIAPALDVNIGKWLTPSLGLRIGYSGISAKGWTSGRTVYAKELAGDNVYSEKFGVSYLHGDIMWNISNALSGYKADRTWNFIPFIGAGWARSSGNGHASNELAVSVGLLNNIRLCNLLDLTLEARHMFVNQRFDGVSRGVRREGMTSVTIGLTFNLGRKGFKRAAAPADYTPYMNKIQTLEQSNTDLTGENTTLADQKKKLADEVEELRNRKVEAAEPKVSASPVALFFSIGKNKLDSKELTNLEFFVKNAVKADKDKVFTLIGSADKATGTKAINQRLSEERMEYIYNLLVNKFGIPADRLVKKAEGDTNNRYAEPVLNRTVIVE